MHSIGCRKLLVLINGAAIGSILGLFLACGQGLAQEARQTEMRTQDELYVSENQVPLGFRQEDQSLLVQMPTCSRGWIDSRCRVGCDGALLCCSGVIDYWTQRQNECASDPVRAAQAIAMACESCNRVCR